MKKVILSGPILSQSGYGEQARFALKALRTRPDLYDIYVNCTTWGKTSWLPDDNEERRFIDETVIKTINFLRNGGKFDLSIQVTIPNELKNMATHNILYTAGIETTKVSPDWLQMINSLANKVITVSNHSKYVLDNTVYKTENGQDYRNFVPVDVVNFGVEDITHEDIDLKLDTDFNFLLVSQWGPRKNINNTVRMFLEEFKDDSNVGLIMKVSNQNQSVPDRFETETMIRNLISNVSPESPKCKIYFLHGNLTKEEMKGLYLNNKVKSLLSFTHGEGFGLPMFEAASNGLPVVTYLWSGQCDYLKKDSICEVGFNLNKIQPEAVWGNILIRDSLWAYVDEKSAKKSMRKMVDDYEAFVLKSQTLKEEINKNFKLEDKLKDFISSLEFEKESGWDEGIEVYE